MAEQQSETEVVLDVSGKFCPVPIVEIARAMKALAPGTVVELVATDPGVETDLPAWCRATRQQLLGIARQGKTLRARVRKVS